MESVEGSVDQYKVWCGFMLMEKVLPNRVEVYGNGSYTKLRAFLEFCKAGWRHV